MSTTVNSRHVCYLGLVLCVLLLASWGTAAEIPCVHELIYEPFAGLILVRVEVAGSPVLTYVLDSGANSSTINDPQLAAMLGLRFREAGLVRGMGRGAARVVITEEVAFSSFGFELFKAPLTVHDIGARLAAQMGREIDGLLGWDIFNRYVIEIEPSGNRILLHDPESFTYQGSGVVLPLEIVEKRPVVQALVQLEEGKKAIPVRLVVDTGSGRYLSLVTGSSRKLKPQSSETRAMSIGVVGEFKVVVGRVHRLELGSFLAKEIETTWTEPFRIPAARNIPKLNGVLGNALLGKYHVFFDYLRGRLILEQP